MSGDIPAKLLPNEHGGQEKTMSTKGKLTDGELIDELKNRFEVNRKALNDLDALRRNLEQVNKKLQDSEALKSHFLSNIRNEINNPLTSIMGLARQLMSSAVDPHKAASTGSLIYSEAFSLDFQLRNIFMAAELEAGEALPAFAHVEITSMVDGAIDLFDHQAELKALRIESACPPELVFTTDAQKLQLMINNLLANAIEYTPEGGKIELSATIEDGQLRLAVRDSGEGIRDSDREAVFDRFRQLEMGTTKSHRGHGLGLSVTAALADLLGGTVEPAESSQAGSTFTLEIPAGEAPEELDTTARDGNFFLFGDAETF